MDAFQIPVTAKLASPSQMWFYDLQFVRRWWHACVNLCRLRHFEAAVFVRRSCRCIVTSRCCCCSLQERCELLLLRLWPCWASSSAWTACRLTGPNQASPGSRMTRQRRGRRTSRTYCLSSRTTRCVRERPAMMTLNQAAVSSYIEQDADLTAAPETLRTSQIWSYLHKNTWCKFYYINSAVGGNVRLWGFKKTLGFKRISLVCNLLKVRTVVFS